MTLSEQEYNLLDKIATKSKMDCWFTIRQKKNGDDYVYDLEESKPMSLKKGVAQLIDGISDMYLDYLNENECHILIGLLTKLLLM